MPASARTLPNTASAPPAPAISRQVASPKVAKKTACNPAPGPHFGPIARRWFESGTGNRTGRIRESARRKPGRRAELPPELGRGSSGRHVQTGSRDHQNQQLDQLGRCLDHGRRRSRTGLTDLVQTDLCKPHPKHSECSLRGVAIAPVRSAQPPADLYAGTER